MDDEEKWNGDPEAIEEEHLANDQQLCDRAFASKTISDFLPTGRARFLRPRVKGRLERRLPEGTTNPL